MRECPDIIEGVRLDHLGTCPYCKRALTSPADRCVIRHPRDHAGERG